MVERIKASKEFERTPEGNPEHHERLSRHYETKAEKSRHEHSENLEKILGKIESTAQTGAELNNSHIDTENPDHNHRNPHFAGKQLKDNHLKRSLRKIQGDLKPYQRPFSKFIHNNTVEQMSEISEKTIARPNGLLIGGLVSFLTSITVLIACKYYGYEYNYFIGLISFPVGFIIGLLGELIFRPLKRR